MTTRTDIGHNFDVQAAVLALLHAIEGMDLKVTGLSITVQNPRPRDPGGMLLHGVPFEVTFSE